MFKIRQLGRKPLNRPALIQKLARLRAGGKARVLDLFSGCGGLSLGFHAAGCEIVAAIDNDKQAAKSHGINFHRSEIQHSFPDDITLTKPRQLISKLGLGQAAQAFDIIVGGPPCQAFARVGRSKLREVADHPEAFRHDPRARLYIDYMSYVEECQPLAIVIENVPDMLNHGGHNIAEEVCEVLAKLSYVCGYTILNSAYYGVPQMRERVFLIGLHRELVDVIRFPEPTHWIDLPSGYEGSRAVALKLLSAVTDDTSPHRYIDPPEAKPGLTPAISVREAIADLPRIDARAQLASGELRRGARRFDKPLPFPRPEVISDYAVLMRDWDDFEAGEKIYDHVIRYLPRDYDLFARLNPGDQYPEAWQHAQDMFEERLREERRTGRSLRKNSRAWIELRDSIVPPYDPTKFPNKWRKMEADKPSRTLLAHLGKDGYSHIHYDSSQARTISVREAARLQSFPDGFMFSGSMNPAFRQIGNAVPPLLAKAVAESVTGQILDALGTTDPMTIAEGA